MNLCEEISLQIIVDEPLLERGDRMGLEARIDQKIAELENLRDIAAALSGEEFDEFDPSTVQNYVLLKIYRLDDLYRLRKLLRRAFGHWADRQTCIWYSGGKAICSWNSDDGRIQIWLRTKVEDFPKELKGNSCDFQPEKVTRTEYSYVCENK